jgi:hypothetical protein
VTDAHLQATEDAEQEWTAWEEERAKGVAEVEELRQKVASAEARAKADAAAAKAGDASEPATPVDAESVAKPAVRSGDDDVDMDTDARKEGAGPAPVVSAPAKGEDKEDTMRADDEDAVEY